MTIAMEAPGIEGELQAQLEAIAADSGCELLQVEFAGGVLRLTLDHEDGVTLAQCETMSRQASALLDVSDFGSGRYTLEVSSPGLDRLLYGPRDYRRFEEHCVRVTWQAPGTGKRTVVGTLARFDEDAATLSLVEEETDEEISIPTDQVLKARLVPQF